MDSLIRVGWILERGKLSRTRVPRALRLDRPINPTSIVMAREKDMPLQEQPSPEGTDLPAAYNPFLLRFLLVFLCF